MSLTEQVLNSDGVWHEVFAAPYETDGSGISKALPGEAVSLDKFSQEDVETVLAAHEGDSEYDDNLVLGQLKDGRWFFIYYGYDYTFTWGGAVVSSDETTLLQYGLTPEQRKVLEV